MSVINQMLNDLDKRQASGRTASPVATAARRQGPSRGLWLMLALSLLIFLWFGLPQYGKKTPRLSDTASSGQPRTYVLRTAISNDDPNAPSDTMPADTLPADSTAQAKELAASAAQVQTTPAQANPAQAAQVAPVSHAPAVNESAPVTAPAVSSRPFVVATPVDLVAPSAASLDNSAALQKNGFVPASAVAFDASRDFPTNTRSSDAPTNAPIDGATAATAQQPVMSVTRVDAKRALASHYQQQLQQAQQAMAHQQWSAARALWQSLLQQDPRQVLVYDQLAYLYQQQQDWVALSALQGQAAALQIHSVPLQLAQLKALAVGQQWTQLLSSITPSLQQQGGVVLALQAKAQQELGQIAQALQTYRQWQQQEPNQARAFLGEALLLEQQGQAAGAVRAYQQALALGGLSPDTESFVQQRLMTQGAR